VNLARRLLGLAAIGLICACSGSTTSGSSGSVTVTSTGGTLNNDGSTVSITAVVKNAQGGPATGSVTFTAPGGDLNASGGNSVSVALNASGQATVTYACNFTVDVTHCGAGQVLVTALWTSVANGTRVTLVGPSSPTTDGGSPPPPPVDAGPVVTGPAGAPAAVIETAVAPEVLGIQGSGIQETGVMSFLVTDSAGRPTPSVAVSFSQRAPALVTLGRTAGVTDNNGQVIVDYTSGTVTGISAIVATVPSTGVSGSHPVAVRGARPSASGFYFRCDKTNLPVYTTTPRFETTTCTVRLSDRYGNRVGVATPVSFAAEAGSISAAVLTKPFDFSNPTDPDEGSATVTFSTDMGNGFAPVETTPFAADATQFPKQRGVEPSNGALNPRDQLVTIIAMVRGEEAFVDANLDGQYNPGELFVDQGDPFLDSNDDNIYDPATEPRFCGGADCATYHGPNGVWDSDRTIWAPTWVVFTGVTVPVPVLTPPPASSVWTPSTGCVDYADNDVPNTNPSVAFALLAVTDRWLNVGPAGTTYTAAFVGTPAGLELVISGGFDELDNTGAMDVSWEKVSAANPTLACTVANTVNGSCVMQTELGIFDGGARIGVQVTNTNKSPTTSTPSPGHACGATPSTGTSKASFQIDASATGPHVTGHGFLNGTFGK